ncbi:IS3 family transposase, partial [Pseudomonas syringae]|uniref:IS3 family transposase n=1 Tax=Pseudomonas syringae TaxID=317 RepID=UPI0035305590
FNDLDELQAGIEEYIEYYNHSRIKLKLNGLSPVEYRMQAAKAAKAAKAAWVDNCPTFGGHTRA